MHSLLAHRRSISRMLRETIVPIRKALQIWPRREHLRQTIKIGLMLAASGP
jgi:hypothetical protein